MARSDAEPYALLGVTPAATSAELTAAFRARVRALAGADDDARLSHLVTAYIHLRRLHHQNEK